MQTISENFLDVTLLVPREKHPTIFSRFDALQSGESLTIFNDHDPKPLYYQLLGERGNVFVWEYLQQGPENWIVKISKPSLGMKEESLGEIAAKDLRKAEVFKKYGLDFCCGGKKSVREACLEKGLDVTIVEQELQQADSAPQGRALPFHEWKLDFLSDYIVNMHHQYLIKYLPELSTSAAKIAQVHGKEHPELLRVQALVEDMKAELMEHMGKEENIVFPFIKHLQMSVDMNTVPKKAAFSTIEDPIKMMEHDHEQVGQILAEIRTLTNDYQLPADACASYAFTFNLLQEMESDLFTHIHLENNILFPKALDLEKSFS